MRLNQYIALHSGQGRRKADTLIKNGRVTVNGMSAALGQNVEDGDSVKIDDRRLVSSTKKIAIMFNKPADYVVSRKGQGSKTIYGLLPSEFQNLKPVGRLDKDSSGLLLLTNDGRLANELTHPRYQKEKVYEISLSRALDKGDFKQITEEGVELEDGFSKFKLEPLNNDSWQWVITMTEGRNRQIRRTFEVLGYKVTKLHRTKFGNYSLDGLASAKWKNTV